MREVMVVEGVEKAAWRGVCSGGRGMERAAWLLGVCSYLLDDIVAFRDRLYNVVDALSYRAEELLAQDVDRTHQAGARDVLGKLLRHLE